MISILEDRECGNIRSEFVASKGVDVEAGENRLRLSDNCRSLRLKSNGEHTSQSQA